MKKVYINGYFTAERINGVPRYAMEIVKRLDMFFKPGEAELVIPKEAKNIPKLKNIDVCTWEDRGCKKEVTGVLWGNFSYKKYIKGKGINVNFSNRGEWIKDSLTTVHDLISLSYWDYDFPVIRMERIKNFIYQCENRLWFAIKIFIKKHTAKYIVTVSEYSKTVIAKKLGIPRDKIIVIGNGWEHINAIEEKNENYDSRIIPHNFYFFIGNVLPHKNMKWIFDEAEYMPNELFVIAGKIPEMIQNSLPESVTNIIFLGYVSEEYMKWLMINCKALLFPSKIEGFGIPPLEELALGGQVIASDIPVFHEIFRDTIHYVSPQNQLIDLNSLLQEKVADPKGVLDIYSWDRAAKEWSMIIESSRM